MTGSGFAALGPSERRVILNCARLELGDALLEEMGEIVRHPLSWDAVLFVAELHGVAPLLYHHLKRFNALGVPHHVRQRLFQFFQRTGYQNRHFRLALAELLEAFAGAGIPVMVLKGFSLLELTYRNVALRPLVDVNLLLPPECVAAGGKVLTRLGYVNSTRQELRRAYGWQHSQSIFVRRREFVTPVLMQWNTVNWPRMHAIDPHRLWAEARTVRLADHDAFVPSVVDLVLYLCLQPPKYGYVNLPAVGAGKPADLVFVPWTENSLIRFTDIFEVVRQHAGTINWEALIGRARSSGVEDSVSASLQWTSELLGPIIPPDVLKGLPSPRPRALRRFLFSCLAPVGAEPREFGGVRGFVKARWLARPRPARLRLVRLLDLLEFMFPRTHEVKIRYRLRSRVQTLPWYLHHVAHSLLQCLLAAVSLGYATARRSAGRILRQSTTWRAWTGRLPQTRVTKDRQMAVKGLADSDASTSRKA